MITPMFGTVSLPPALALVQKLSGGSFNPTASLILLNRPLTHVATARTSWQGVKQGPREADAQCGDGVRHVALRAQRQNLGVGNLREGQVASLARRRPVLRGESSPSRRSGIRRLRSTPSRLHCGV